MNRLASHRLSGTVAVVEQRAEQWRRCGHAAATLGQRQRGVFVAEQRCQMRMGRPDPGAHVLLSHGHPQRQGIDKHPQCPASPFATAHAPQQHRAEHNIITPAKAPKHLCPGEVMQARRAHSLQPGLSPQTLAQLDGQSLVCFFDAMAVAAHIVQTERQRRFIDVAEHLAEKTFVLFVGDAESGLGHVVTVRHRLAQGVGLAVQVRMDFVLDQFQGCMVDGDVMKQQHRHPALIDHVVGEGQPEQGCLADIEAVMPWVEALLQLLTCVASGRVNGDFAEHQISLSPDNLHWLGQAFPYDAGTQDVVAIDDLLQGRGELVETFPAGNRELCLQYVRVALPGGDMVIKNAFLQGRQRVDVLHIAHTARDAGHDGLDGGLVECYQRQHVRGDALAARRNRLSRNLHFIGLAAVILAGIDQFDQRRLVLAQHRQHGGLGEGLPLAADEQLVALDGKLHIFLFQYCQQFDHAHRTISILSVVAAYSKRVGCSKSDLTSASRPSWRMRSIRLTASSEWPPSSKKWSCRPTCETPSNACQISAISISLSPCGAS
ncbi:Uncharacterized protein ALO91_05859 [Pseudomonas syringae pv. aceris]|uniref:Uncharacterized protein n=1 Tax=Pseudomonas syringae pv. aceris TaxID=199198 RepID=A0A0P9HNN7_PSESX|nr:Uncharacterized protein ALO91_05859 [Pseudomonas syringae pv. aceris]